MNLASSPRLVGRLSARLFAALCDTVPVTKPAQETAAGWNGESKERHRGGLRQVQPYLLPLQAALPELSRQVLFLFAVSDSRLSVAHSEGPPPDFGNSLPFAWATFHHPGGHLPRTRHIPLAMLSHAWAPQQGECIVGIDARPTQDFACQTQ